MELSRSELRVGALLAEGGEGKVFELPDRPGTLLKQYPRPVDADGLRRLVAWAGPGGPLAPGMAARVRSATAWPQAVVLDGPDRAAGLLMARAPRRFSLRHRDGVARLATLSYLTADPVRRAAAYGLMLPGQGDPARIGLVYALARVLEALESADPPVGHGDLSAKNVLWSTRRGPEVFLLDCDNGERFGPDGAPLGAPGRRRAMTPNWDDPTVPAGQNPGLEADRYSLALIFLRIVGAGHFPVQKRQKAGEAVDIELDLPAAVLRSPVMAPDAPVWALLGRSLSAADPEGRPPASTWAAALHDVLAGLGATSVIEAVHAAQGSSAPSLPAQPVAGPAAPDVTVRPHPIRPRAQVWTSSHAGGRSPAALAAPRPSGRAVPTATGSGYAPAGTPGLPPPGSPVVHPPLPAQAKVALRQAFAAWKSLHAWAGAALSTPGRRGAGVRRAAVCAVVDFVVACVGLLLFAMIVSPFLGI
ncbi:hypothetical protein K6U06_06385 [Acidiferrimicrobium sp. IK]|uniref:hypothetical protein n=1 Tax=Acidiferrimicrobium sp. IK TaxID=2871700 RepID=UPI0021CAE809|nr:hypothetical protein [Acidiferrimicrobium sp. IK]MCU4183980.1 hypothetical protein [Acidiferrimicrobium sp. IK]